MERWRRWSDSNVLMLFKLKDKTKAGDLAPMSEAAVALSLHLKALDWKLHLVSFDRSLPPPITTSFGQSLWTVSVCLSLCIKASIGQLWSLSLPPPIKASFGQSLWTVCLSVSLSWKLQLLSESFSMKASFGQSLWIFYLYLSLSIKSCNCSDSLSIKASFGLSLLSLKSPIKALVPHNVGVRQTD